MKLVRDVLITQVCWETVPHPRPSNDGNIIVVLHFVDVTAVS